MRRRNCKHFQAKAVKTKKSKQGGVDVISTSPSFFPRSEGIPFVITCVHNLGAMNKLFGHQMGFP